MSRSTKRQGENTFRCVRKNTTVSARNTNGESGQMAVDFLFFFNFNEPLPIQNFIDASLVSLAVPTLNSDRVS